MQTHTNPWTRRGAAWALLVGATMTLSGCAAMRPDADPDSSFKPDWGSALRVPTAKTEVSGLSETSRQIERNLGVE